jgi:hypothetical protein
MAPAGEVLGPGRHVEIRLPNLPERPAARDGDALPVFDVASPAGLPVGLVSYVPSGAKDVGNLVVAAPQDRLLERHKVGVQLAKALGKNRRALLPRPAPPPQI